MLVTGRDTYEMRANYPKTQPGRPFPCGHWCTDRCTRVYGTTVAARAVQMILWHPFLSLKCCCMVNLFARVKGTRATGPCHVHVLCARVASAADRLLLFCAPLRATLARLPCTLYLFCLRTRTLMPYVQYRFFEETTASLYS